MTFSTGVFPAVLIALFLNVSAAAAASIDTLYFSRSGELYEVGFDGTSYLGGSTLLEEVNPPFTAMTLGYLPEVPLPGGLSLLGSLGALLVFRRRARA